MQSLDFSQQIFFCLLRQLLCRTPLAAAAASFNRQPLRTFRQIDALPCGNAFVVIDLELSRCFSVSQFFCIVSTISFLNSGVYRLFGTPFGIKLLHLSDIILLHCLTNVVQFIREWIFICIILLWVLEFAAILCYTIIN